MRRWPFVATALVLGVALTSPGPAGAVDVTLLGCAFERCRLACS
jgi:hypothetical protein